MTNETVETVSDKTLVTFLLDRSDSMDIVRESTIEAFNGYLGQLKTDPKGIDFTFLQFDTQSLDKLCVAQPVESVALLTTATYVPRGGTPLIDAVYKTIKAVETAVTIDSTKPKVIICVQTDGEENASIEYTWEALNALVREKIEIGWQFNFMGAGIDAYAQGAKMGIAAVQTVSYDHLNPKAARATFSATAENTQSFARGLSADTAYSAEQRTSADDRYTPTSLSGLGGSPTTTRRLTPTYASDLDLTKHAQTKPVSNERKKTVSDFSL